MMLWRNTGMDKSKFNIFKFKFGDKKKSLKETIKLGAIIHLTLDTVALIPGVDKRKAFNLLDEFQQKMGIKTLNDYIIRDDELISYRIHRVVDKAIEEYEKDV
jgi:ERCC4-type nuclease